MVHDTHNDIIIYFINVHHTIKMSVLIKKSYENITQMLTFVPSFRFKFVIVFT